jgi:hypothetical protein
MALQDGKESLVLVPRQYQPDAQLTQRRLLSVVTLSDAVTGVYTSTAADVARILHETKERPDLSLVQYCVLQGRLKTLFVLLCSVKPPCDDLWTLVSNLCSRGTVDAACKLQSEQIVVATVLLLSKLYQHDPSSAVSHATLEWERAKRMYSDVELYYRGVLAAIYERLSVHGLCAYVRDYVGLDTLRILHAFGLSVVDKPRKRRRLDGFL